MLEAVLDFAFGSSMIDFSRANDDVFTIELDALEGGAISDRSHGEGRSRSVRMRGWRERLEKVVKSGTAMLIGSCIVLGSINWIVGA